MPILLTRVTNEQTIVGDASILIDKIDKSQGNSDSPPYAQRAKQKVYVPYWNPIDASVKGYIDMVQTDEVMLSMEKYGTIGALETEGIVSVAVFSSALIATPAVTGAANALGTTTIDGTTFLSLTPDVTYVDFINPAGVTQRIEQTDFASHIATQITVLDGKLTGVPGAGWTVTVQANSKLSNVQPL